MAKSDVRENREQERGGQDRIDARQAAERAAAYLEGMTGEQPEVVIAVEPDEDRWLVQLEMLELARVPTTTDVLGCYEVEVSFDGEPVAYRRLRRYHRGQVGEQ